MMRSNLWEWALHNRQLGIYFLIVAIAAGAFSYVPFDCGEYPYFVIIRLRFSRFGDGQTLKMHSSRLPNAGSQS
jgi:hypothetical protein